MGLPVEVNNLMLGSLGGYTVGRSLRFRSSASAYLNRTPASAGNRQKFTWSGWVKRGTLGASAGSIMFSAYNGAGNQDLYLAFGSTTGTGTADTLNFFAPPAGNNINVVSAGVYRDTSAWYHIVCAVDTTQATAANRVRLYVNGSEISYGSSSYPSLNQSLSINSTNQHTIGVNGGVTSWGYLDGYLGEINFIDGQQLTPSSFGAYDTNGVWQPKKYSGTYGTNGFYLPFSNTTSTTTLVADSSGNGNNWTPNNISLTAGTTYDSMIDSPTNAAGGSTGIGNYAVLNPLLPVSVTGYSISDGNLKFTTTNVTSSASTINLPQSGKWYWEATLSAGTAANLGVVDNTYQLVAGSNPADQTQYGYSYDNATGKKINNAIYTTYGATYTTNDIIGVAFDSDNGTLAFYKNGTSQGTAFTGLTGKIYYPFFALFQSTWTVNFGQRPFTYTPPSGFKALNTYNLPAPSIANGAQYMAATTYTGNGSTQSINNGTNNTLGITFQPDLVWVKTRVVASSNALFDSVRGATKVLVSNSTNAEANLSPNGVSAFNSGGFSVTDDSAGNNYVNGASGGTYSGTPPNYVAWNWKGGGTGVTNNSGTITSTVSANTTAGFSVVTWTAGGAGTTIGHGLGVAPNMIIVKDRSVSADWCVYTTTTGAGAFLKLNSTAASAADTTMWGNTTPTSTTFKWGYSTGDSMVAYCFAAVRGYSAFGSYTGNGSTDGPFVYTGFRPRWIIIKCTSAAGSWVIIDSSRNGYNANNDDLYANLSDAEFDSNRLDILSNGWKDRNTYGSSNASGATYVYAAFAEHPFQASRAR